jgi:hypothetical protein
LCRFMVDSLTLSSSGVPLESSGLRFSSGRSMNIRLVSLKFTAEPRRPSSLVRVSNPMLLFHGPLRLFLTIFRFNNV